MDEQWQLDESRHERREADRFMLQVIGIGLFLVLCVIIGLTKQ